MIGVVKMKIDKSKILRIVWSKREKDFVIHYPSSPDGSLISQLIRPWKSICKISMVDSYIDKTTEELKYYRGSLGEYTLLEKDWLKELDRRGYDLTTLKFSIQKKEG